MTDSSGFYHPVGSLGNADDLRFRICRVGIVLVALLVALMPSSSFAQATGTSGDEISGTWRGVLGTGAVKLHLVLTITKLSNGGMQVSSTA